MERLQTKTPVKTLAEVLGTKIGLIVMAIGFAGPVILTVLLIGWSLPALILPWVVRGYLFYLRWVFAP